MENFGCRATQSDGAAIERQLLERGLERAPEAGMAEIVVLNTCTVTASADQDVRAAVRRIHRGNPECKILVTGCYAQRAPQELAALPGVNWVVGNSHKQQVGNVVCGAPGFVPLGDVAGPSSAEEPLIAQIMVGDIFAHTELMAAPVFDGGAEKTRPNLKVQTDAITAARSASSRRCAAPVARLRWSKCWRKLTPWWRADFTRL